MPAESPRGFRRELTLLDATMIVVGSLIGSGIFIVSADIARTMGSGGWLLAVWIVSGLVTVVAALSYGELAGMFPQAGGQYVYLREAFNPLIGFLYGWTFFLVIQTGSIAAVGVAFAKFTSVLFPSFGEGNILFEVAGLRVSAAQVLAIGSVAFLTWINTRGIRIGKLIQDSFTFTKTAALLGLAVLGLAVGLNADAIAENFARFWDTSAAHFPDADTAVPLTGILLFAAFGAASVGSLFALDGWNGATFTAEETLNPRHTVPKSLVLGVSTVAVLYVIVNLVYVLLLPVVGTPDGSTATERGIQYAADDRVGTAAAHMIFGTAAAVVMAVFIMISTFGCNNGFVITGARCYYAMAKDGLFFRSVGTLNRHRVPGASLVAQGVWASVLCLSGKYGDLLDYVIFATLLFYILAIAGIFVLRRKRPDAARPYRAWGYPVIPALYILVAAAICVDLLIYKPDYTWPGLVIVLLGIPVYYVWRRVGRANGS